MLRIGQFATRAGVTVKALRHYARLGLLKPSWVDRTTGYRYYTLEQLPRLERIREMQRMGFTLDQVKGVLDLDLNTARMQELLTRKRLEVIQRLRQEEARLAQVEWRLAQSQPQICLTGDQMERKMEQKMEMTTVTKPTLVIVGLCYQGDNANNEIAGLWTRFNARANEIKHILPEAAYGVCSMVSGLPEGHFEYVAGFAVSQIDQLPEGMMVRIVPAYTYAAFVHRGGFETLKNTYHNIYHVWLPQLGLKPAGNLDMEVYTEEFKGFAEDSVFYIYVPIKQA